MYQAFIIATRPYPEKASEDQFYLDLDSAESFVRLDHQYLV